MSTYYDTGIRRGTLSGSSPADFTKFLASQEVECAQPAVVVLKGYGSGLKGDEYHAEVLRAIGEADVLVWDGDWLKPTSFTSVILAWLQANPRGRAVAVRKSDGNVWGFIKSWAECPPEVRQRMVVALVAEAELHDAQAELRDLGLPEADLHNTALGWVSLRAAGSRVVSVGGAKSCVNEARACLALQQRTGAPPCSWCALDIERTTELLGKQRPVALLEVVAQLTASAPVTVPLVGKTSRRSLFLLSMAAGVLLVAAAVAARARR